MRKVELIDGWPAARWILLAQAGVIVGLALVVVSFLLVASESAFLPLALVVLLASVAVQYTGFLRAAATERREIAAGYTSIKRTRNLDVDQVDAESGFVIREAGSPLLRREEYAAVIEAIRAS